MTRISAARITMEGGRVDNSVVKDYGETAVGGASGTNAGGSYEIDLSDGNFFNLILNTNCALTYFKNALAFGAATSFTLVLTQDSTGGRTVTWPANVYWAGGFAPQLTWLPSKRDVLTFISTDAGASWIGTSSGFNFAAPSSELAVPGSEGSVFGNLTGRAGLAAAFDGNSNQAFGSTAGSAVSPPVSSYVGKNFSSSKAIAKATVSGSNDLGYGHTGTPSITLTLYGKNGLPSSSTDGTSLGTATFTETDNESAGRTITSSDTTTPYTYVWVTVSSSAGNDHFVAEVTFYQNMAIQ